MKTKDQGVTLVELVACVAVMAVVAAVSIPSFSRLLADSRYATASHELTAALATARGQAVTRRMRIAVCPMAEGDRCGGPADWTHGWMIFEDPDAAGTPSGPEAIMRTHQRLSRHGHLQMRSTAGRRLVRFAPNGMAGGTNLTISICNAAGEALLGQVVVSRTGRARSARAVAGGSTPCPGGP